MFQWDWLGIPFVALEAVWGELGAALIGGVSMLSLLLLMELIVPWLTDVLMDRILG